MSDGSAVSKVCTQCKQEKGLSEFYRNKACRLGVDSRCKACALAYANARYAEKIKDPDFAARRKVQMQAATRRKYLSLDADGMRRRREVTADWRDRNPDAMAEQYRRWRIGNADRVRAKNNRRRARLVEAFVADVDPQAIWARDGGICRLCDEPIDPDLAWPDPMSKTLDHVVPLAMGGTHEPANVQLAHALCNCIKGDRITQKGSR